MSNYAIVILNGKVVATRTMEDGTRYHLPPGATLRTFATVDEANAAIAAQKLTPYGTKADKANADLAAIYNALSDADKATYGVLFAPVKALVDAGKFAEAATVLGAVTIPGRLAATLAQMLAILNRPS